MVRIELFFEATQRKINNMRSPVTSDGCRHFVFGVKISHVIDLQGAETIDAHDQETRAVFFSRLCKASSNIGK